MSNPLAVLGREFGVVLAVVVVIILTAVAGWAGVRLDGALDLYVGAIPTWLLIVESLIAWLSPALFLFLFSKVFRSRGRIADHLAASGLARFPYIFAAIILSKPLLGGTMLQLARYNRDGIGVDLQQVIGAWFIVGVLAMALLVLWSIAMLYLGFKEASRLSTGRALLAFILGVAIAEVSSHYLIAAMLPK